MLIDYTTLTDDAIKGIAEQFVISQLSETEDQFNVATWVEQAINSVKSGELLIEYSEVDESVALKHKAEVNQS